MKDLGSELNEKHIPKIKQLLMVSLKPKDDICRLVNGSRNLLKNEPWHGAWDGIRIGT
jgi:hypothetical protein